MRPWIFVLILMPCSLSAGPIEEIRVSDIDRQICLRADGTARMTYRGEPNRLIEDERVGSFQASVRPRIFQRLAGLPGAMGFEKLDRHYVPYAMAITWTTVVRDGLERTLERDERAIDADPEPPQDLWALEMAVRGVAAELKWDPIESGLIVDLDDTRQSRLVMVREAGSNYVVAAVRSSRDQVRISVPPANYVVEVTTVLDQRSVDLWHVPCTIAEKTYVRIREEDSYDRLLICTPNGWWLRVEDDGSGTIGHGPVREGSVDFERGTIRVSKVMHDLGKLAQNDNQLGYRFIVHRRTEGDRAAPYYSKDADTILPLFTTAVDPKHTTRRGTEFQRLWEFDPPKLGEPLTDPAPAKPN